MSRSCACEVCGATLDQLPRDPRCPDCRGPLDYHGGPTPEFVPTDLARRPPTMWRYREALPQIGTPVSLGEIMTPLVPLQAGSRQVLVKCEYQLPTGSYKDRGAAVLLSYLRHTGVQAAVEDSSGNAGAALAAYAARAGIHLRVFCPDSTAGAKLAQITLTGAALERVPGPRQEATRALGAYLARTGAVYASHLWHPLFLDGVKTMAFEITEQLGWVAPAAVVCPVGAGSILLGLYRGFGDLRRAGIIPRLPRLVAVQSGLADAVYQAFTAGAEQVAPVFPSRPTVASGIALPAPARGTEVLQALRRTRGTVVTVDEDDILSGQRALAQAGFGVEPTSAVVWHALLRLEHHMPLPAGAVVVGILSGHGLKSAAAPTMPRP